MKKKRLFLLDIMPLLYRAHFATMGKRFATTTGIDTRTTLVFYNYIFQVIAEEKPDAIAAALDSKAKQRVAVSSTYKANREKMPGEIYDAFPYAMRLLDALQIPVLKEEGYEADDVIASIALKAADQQYEVFIVSPDKDFAQLVTNDIFLFRPAYKGAVMETLNIEGVKNKYGVAPQQIADYLALRGDSVDNIIGVKGIGDKTAASLLAEYRSVENLLKQAENIKQPKVKEAIINYHDQLIENKALAILTGDVPVSLEWNELKINHADKTKLLPLLSELQFTKMQERLARLGLIKDDAPLKNTEPKNSLPVQELNLNELNQLATGNLLAVAYLEQEPLFIYVKCKTTPGICRLQANTDEEWNDLIKQLDAFSQKKTGWQLKPLLAKIHRHGIVLNSEWIDLSLAAYLLEPDAKIEWQYVADKYELRDEPICEKAEIVYLPALFEAYNRLTKRMDELELSRLFFNIEVPLQMVIIAMELHGIKIDEKALSEIDHILSAQMKELEQRLYEMAGSPFNINSPSKTAEILQTICAPSELKKTKTGQVSTAEPFLVDLAPKYPFIADLLSYRKLNKIITNYVTALPGYLSKVTNKIHPTFQQMAAGTGRIICTEPNLQNLPVRNEAGREVRKAIISSAPGFSIVSIDYNQVELRLLAVLSGDPVMTETFRLGKDIHTTTASRVFKVPEEAVTKEMRSKAKGVNFGIAYGITPWGLASRLKISQKEAKEIIDAYFEEFGMVRAYLEKSVDQTRERGFSRTQYGRIRYIDGIDSKNGTTRKVAERVAVNAPLQGLAADVIKDAMVAVHRYIIKHELDSRLILQVHDELVFDAADYELEQLIPEVVRIMESRGAFAVPLKVNVTIGKNWFEQNDYMVKTKASLL